jgi:hypothetical protein
MSNTFVTFTLFVSPLKCKLAAIEHDKQRRTRFNNFYRWYVARPTEIDLILLLTEPAETLTIEHKSWLDLNLVAARANLAKAAIALANEGGGIIVVGTRASSSTATLQSLPRPDGIDRYTVDIINSAVTRFADPPFHCELTFANHPVTKVEHAFVLVPGGMTVPVMSCRGSDGEIQAQRCYVRKPGPKSEEPYTSDEWRIVLDRCLQARRETMLDAIRAIVTGRSETQTPEPTPTKQLQDFRAKSVVNWNKRIRTLPENDPGRMPLGRYQIFFKILDVPSAPSLAELLQRIEKAGNPRLTGWGPFIHLQRDPYVPGAVDDGIETWLGQQEAERWAREPHHCDFWRAEPEGNFFLVRGFDEDGVDRVKPGSSFDVTLPVWRIAEPMYFAARIAKLFGRSSRILFGVRYDGLHGRNLISIDKMRFMRGEMKAIDDNFEFLIETNPEQISDNLAEMLQPVLRPLYERFSFFHLPDSLIVEELEKLRGGRF